MLPLIMPSIRNATWQPRGREKPETSIATSRAWQDRDALDLICTRCHVCVHSARIQQSLLYSDSLPMCGSPDSLPVQQGLLYCSFCLGIARKASCTADYLPIQQSLLYCGFSSYTAVPAVLLILLRYSRICCIGD